MPSRIEKMNKIRKNIFLVALIGTVLSFALFMVPSFITSFHFTQRAMISFKVSMGLLLLSIIIFIVRYWIYKQQLKEDSSLSMAVNDERIKLCWLKAYRFSFLVVVSLAIFWKWEESGYYPEIWRVKMPLPDMTFLIIYGSVISLIASFLWHSRDVKKKERT